MKYLFIILILLSTKAQAIDWNADTTQTNQYDYTDYNYNEYQASGQSSLDIYHQQQTNKLELQRQEQNWINNTSPAERMPDYSYPIR